MEGGSRNYREEQMLSLKEAEWNLDTLLDLHYGFLDRSESVRLCALEALLEIAGRPAKPITVSPISLLETVIYTFTVSSGATPLIFRFLVQLDTPEADQAVIELLKGSVRGRNEDFKIFVNAVVEAGKSELLQDLKRQELSQTKARIMRQILD
ncbi:MAG: hypothetical protein JSV16_13895 [Candidatus Hydrogenedentota bacterium]|nr:MAG: hypothetical protein JSV16_13895 [Candidatus Hydrogenedentota bacterium]